MRPWRGWATERPSLAVPPNRKRIAELAAAKRLPAGYENRVQVLARGLMSYGADLRENFLLAESYVDGILRGTLPVIQASRFELGARTDLPEVVDLI